MEGRARERKMEEEATGLRRQRAISRLRVRFVFLKGLGLKNRLLRSGCTLRKREGLRQPIEEMRLLRFPILYGLRLRPVLAYASGSSGTRKADVDISVSDLGIMHEAGNGVKAQVRP